ncbi:ankyrin repeat-containing domain protein, partial [Halenospora varia]
PSFPLEEKDYHGLTALDAACCGTSTLVVETLLNRESEVTLNKKRPQSPSSTHSPFYLAAYWNRTKIVELILRKGNDPNVKTDMNRTPLYYAAALGNLKVVKILIIAKADVD